MRTSLKPTMLCLSAAVAIAMWMPLGTHAESLASTAVSAASTSVGSLSNSVGTSSHSSGGPRVAEGRYRITDVAELTDKPGHLRLTLQAERGETQERAMARTDGGFTLDVPVVALGARGAAVGELIDVRHRAYGLAFARDVNAPAKGSTPANTTTPRMEVFFLALDDAWRRELDPVPVKS